MRKETWGSLGLLTVTILWGGGFIATDRALLAFTPLKIMTMRFLIASLIFLPFSLKLLKRADRKAVLSGCVLGFFLFAAFLLQTLGLKYSTPSKNAFLTTTNVVFVPLLLFLFEGKKVQRAELLAVLLSLVGAAVLSLEHDFSIGKGEVLSLLCAICFAFQIYLTGRFVKDYSPLLINALQMAVAFALSLIATITLDTTLWDWSNTGSTFSLFYLGAISTSLTFALQSCSQKWVPQVKTVILLSLEGVFATIFSVILLHEHIPAKGIVGSLMILASAFLAELWPGREEV